jgi:hypothetical protein
MAAADVQRLVQTVARARRHAGWALNRALLTAPHRGIGLATPCPFQEAFRNGAGCELTACERAAVDHAADRYAIIFRRALVTPFLKRQARMVRHWLHSRSRADYPVTLKRQRAASLIRAINGHSLPDSLLYPSDPEDVEFVREHRRALRLEPGHVCDATWVCAHPDDTVHYYRTLLHYWASVGRTALDRAWFWIAPVAAQDSSNTRGVALDARALFHLLQARGVLTCNWTTFWRSRRTTLPRAIEQLAQMYASLTPARRDPTGTTAMVTRW